VSVFWPAAVYWLAVPLLVAVFGFVARRLQVAEFCSFVRVFDSRLALLALGAATSLFLA
jgi:hypothetical protein